MIFPLFRRPKRAATISALYGMIVAQARMPSFYQSYAVADTVNGRFDLLVMHLALVLERLGDDPDGKALSQELFDMFCADMDGNLREIGISDLKVPQEMRRMGEAFYGRAQAYRTALAAADDSTLTDTVRRNIYGGAPARPDAPGQLAAYMRDALRELAAQDMRDLAAGRLHFPDPSNHIKIAG